MPDHGPQCSQVSGLCGYARQLQLRCDVARIDREYPAHDLHELVFARRIALPLDLSSELVGGAQVSGIGVEGGLQTADGRTGVSALAFKHTQQVVDLAVMGGQGVCTSQTFGSLLVGALPQGEDSPVDPRGGLPGSQGNRFSQTRFGPDIVSNLQACRTRVERREKGVIRPGGRSRHRVPAFAGSEHRKKTQPCCQGSRAAQVPDSSVLQVIRPALLYPCASCSQPPDEVARSRGS